MSERIAVLPAAPAYVGVLKHPIDGPLKAEGSLWTYDGFTCRMLTDGAIMREPVEPVASEDAQTADPVAIEADPDNSPGGPAA